MGDISIAYGLILHFRTAWDASKCGKIIGRGGYLRLAADGMVDDLDQGAFVD